MKTKVMMLVGLFGLFAVVSGYGQPSALKAKIDFSFKVEGKVLPPGEYEFTRDSDALTFRVQGQGREAAIASIMSRMAAAIHTTAEDSHLVFDVVGDTYLLSEIWIPGEDGYLIQATKGPHTHKVVNIKY